MELYKKNQLLKQAEREAEKSKYSPINLRKNVSFYVSKLYKLMLKFIIEWNLAAANWI